MLAWDMLLSEAPMTNENKSYLARVAYFRDMEDNDVALSPEENAEFAAILKAHPYLSIKYRDLELDLSRD